VIPHAVRRRGDRAGGGIRSWHELDYQSDRAEEQTDQEKAAKTTEPIARVKILMAANDLSQT
jgi:hypothetical protein